LNSKRILLSAINKEFRGNELKFLDIVYKNKQTDALIACCGGGSNAIGMFHPFINDHGTRLIGVEAGGDGIETQHHSAPLNKGIPGVLHGTFTYLMQDPNGQITETHSISAVI